MSTPAVQQARRLHPDFLAYLQRGLSIHVGGRDAQGNPQLNRAIDLRVEPDHRLSLLLPSPDADDLIVALRASPQIAVVLCQPTTHHAVQVKGVDAEVLPTRAQDWPDQAAFKRRFVQEIEPYGFGDDFASAWLDPSEGELFWVRFTPQGAWNQTPGPGAGQPMVLWA